MPTKIAPADTASTSLSLPVEGMTCASCVARVERAIAAVPGVTSASVNLATERADVRFDGRADVGAVAEAIAQAGLRDRNRAARAFDRGHDLRLLRGPHRARLGRGSRRAGGLGEPGDRTRVGPRRSRGP